MKKYRHTVDGEIAQKLITLNEIFYEADLSLGTYYSISWNNNRTGNSQVPGHVKFIAFLSMKNFIIEISKLLKESKNEHYNMFHFIDFIRKERSDYNFDIDQLTDFYDRLSSMNETINQIIRIRDKRFAHNDYDEYRKIISFIGNRETSPIIVLLKEIIDYLNKTVKINPNLYYDKFKTNEFLTFWDDVYIKIINK